MRKNKLPSRFRGQARAGICLKSVHGLAVCLVLIFSGAIARAEDPSVTQQIVLRAGWNAVYLSVDPPNPQPQAVFTNQPVDKVAAYFSSRTPVEFIQDPASIPWKQKGWNVWYAPALPEGQISDLSALSGGQGYLVHALSATVVNVTGKPGIYRTRWKSDAYNFTGFPVDPANPPTFASWFAGSSAHQSTKHAAIYALNDSAQWVVVDHPELTVITPGVAYWVFCQGASDYQGPVDISIPFGGQGTQANFGDANSKLVLRLARNVGTPTRATMSLDSVNGLSLSYQQRSGLDGSTLTIPFTSTVVFDLPDVGQKDDVSLVLDRATLGANGGSAILTVRDEIGTLVRVPVSATQP